MTIMHDCSADTIDLTGGIDYQRELDEYRTSDKNVHYFPSPGVNLEVCSALSITTVHGCKEVVIFGDYTLFVCNRREGTLAFKTRDVSSFKTISEYNPVEPYAV